MRTQPLEEPLEHAHDEMAAAQLEEPSRGAETQHKTSRLSHEPDMRFRCSAPRLSQDGLPQGVGGSSPLHAIPKGCSGSCPDQTRSSREVRDLPSRLARRSRR